MSDIHICECCSYAEKQETSTDRGVERKWTCSHPDYKANDALCPLEKEVVRDEEIEKEAEKEEYRAGQEQAETFLREWRR